MTPSGGDLRNSAYNFECSAPWHQPPSFFAASSRLPTLVRDILTLDFKSGRAHSAEMLETKKSVLFVFVIAAHFTKHQYFMRPMGGMGCVWGAATLLPSHDGLATCESTWLKTWVCMWPAHVAPSLCNMRFYSPYPQTTDANFCFKIYMSDFDVNN
jgi:hypothetical protein